jgi:hypothetical protein
MDADHFKRRQRQLGITSDDLGRAIGRDRTVISKIYSNARPMKAEEVPVFARLLDMTIDEVIERAGLKAGSTVRAMTTPGFSDQEAVPFDWTGRGDLRDRLAGPLGFDRPGVDVWAVKGRSMDLAGYVDGDMIVVDSHRAERARAGDDVLAQVYDLNHADAQRVFRRYDPPFLFAISTDQAELKPMLVDNERVVIVGVVTSSWRQK